MAPVTAPNDGRQPRLKPQRHAEPDPHQSGHRIDHERDAERGARAAAVAVGNQSRRCPCRNNDAGQHRATAGAQSAGDAGPRANCQTLVISDGTTSKAAASPRRYQQPEQPHGHRRQAHAGDAFDRARSTKMSVAQTTGIRRVRHGQSLGAAGAHDNVQVL